MYERKLLRPSVCHWRLRARDLRLLIIFSIYSDSTKIQTSRILSLKVLSGVAGSNQPWYVRVRLFG